VLVSAQQLDMTSSGNGIWNIDGDIEMVQEETKMYASHCVWDREANTAVFTENVRVVTKDHTITADRCDADFDDKVAVLVSDAPRRVHVYTKKERKPGTAPKEDDEADKYEHMVWETDCDRVEYNYGDDKGVASGNVVSRSQDGKYTIYSENVYYEKLENEDEIITIPDSPRVETNEGEWFKCQSAVINSMADGSYNVKLVQPSAHVVANKEKGQGGGGGATGESGAAAPLAPGGQTGPAPAPQSPPKPTDGGGANEGGQG